jgi:hypothetical protein
MKTTFLVRIILMFLIAFSNNMSAQSIVVKPNLENSDSLSQWELDGSGKWKISDGKLVLYEAGIPSGSIRRPSALALLKTKPLKNVTVEAEIKSTAPLDVIRRDLDIIISYESPSRFYYIHLSGVSDDVHNGIFLVNNADRRRIDSGVGKPLLYDSEWHYVRVEREGESGRIEVYVDNSKEPVLKANDTTIYCGLAGIGSFDDTGEFRNIVITGDLK